ncbi:MAG: hypothetical protein HY319_16830 [Armatimonadetes bacterium]|nr:hypothetical protein [Armatimonadota bacterium]
MQQNSSPTVNPAAVSSTESAFIAVSVRSVNNLVPWLAIAGGRIRCQEVTMHTLSNGYVVDRFTGISCVVEGDTLTVLR